MKYIFIYVFFSISILGCKKNDKSWTAVNNGLTNDGDNSEWVNTMTTQMDNVYASVQVGTDYGASFEIGIYLSSNHGKSWRAVNNGLPQDRKSTRLNSSHANISYA